MNKTDLYKLIDTLPASKLPVARAYLEGLRAGSETVKNSLEAFLCSVPEEDEVISEEEESEVRAAENDIRENGTVSHEEARRFLIS